LGTRERPRTKCSKQLWRGLAKRGRNKAKMEVGVHSLRQLGRGIIQKTKKRGRFAREREEHE